MDQEGENRLVNHLLYASPVRRGNGIEVIEDIVPLYDVHVTIRMEREPVRLYLAPEMEELPFVYENGALSYTLPQLSCHAMAVIEYEKE